MTGVGLTLCPLSELPRLHNDILLSLQFYFYFKQRSYVANVGISILPLGIFCMNELRICLFLRFFWLPSPSSFLIIAQYYMKLCFCK